VLRQIGYAVAHRHPKDPVPVVLFSGTRTDEATAALAAQISATLVRDGLRVTLVDADRAHPRLNRVFGAPDAPGLSDALAGRKSARDILHIGADGNLRFLAAGSPTDRTPATEKELKFVFHDLANPTDTDVVIVSGPTVWGLPTIVPLEKASTGMVLVAGADATAGESVSRVRRLLSNGYKPRILGVVVGPSPLAAGGTSVPVVVENETEGTTL
jgi:Mrp family chromosome partitioning ATPase